MKKWIRKSSEIILDKRNLRIRKDIVELPEKEIKEWFYWDSIDSVMILGMKTKNKLMMIRQYRYVVGDEVVEFPSGLLNKGEDFLDAAKREFLEETGHTCDNFIKLGAFYETYGSLNRRIHMFFSKDIKPSSQNLDRGKRGYEDIEVEEIELEEAVKLALENKVVGMGPSLAILLLNEKISRGEIKL